MNTGDYLGRYRIVRKIGEGGMGEVFLAEDPKLARQIAVKVLSADFASDSDRMARFVYEAISASSLNHPNIITIYEINDEHEPPFIAMEYVDGETLGRRIKRSPLEVHETLDVAIQVSTALAAAHDANVVHRDVKPDNVILRPDGLVKVLDFGLAKQVAPRTVTSFEEMYAGVPEVKTHPGLVMGTVAYMSPEQARGKLVDARSDIFSFGAMLYQMASGRLPFIGENDIDVVGSILHKEPRPLSQAPRPVPHDVELLIKKALRKNRDERYQSMRELVADLREIREDLRVDSKNELKSNGNGHSNGHASSELSEAERGMPTEKMHAAGIMSTRELSMPPSTLSGILFSEIKQHPIRSLSYSLLFAVLLTGLFYGAYMVAESWRRPEIFQTMQMAKLTYSGNVESFSASISPDGKYVAYVVDNDGEEGLLVKQRAADSSVTIIPQGPHDISGVSFSPDSNFVYYSMATQGGQSALYQAPAIGGPARKLISDAQGPVTFSPNGKTIAFIRGWAHIMLADPDGGNIKELAKAGDGNRYFNLSWSPKGDVIAAVYYSHTDSNDHLSQVSVADGLEKPIESQVWLRLRGLSWLPDASGLVVSGRDPEMQRSQLWEIDYPGGATRRITNDLQVYNGAVLTRDGSTILSVQEKYRSNLWTSMGAAGPKQISTEIARDEGMSGVAISAGGKIAYTVRVKGDQDIWIANADGSDHRQITFDAKANYSPVFSPDGQYLVFVSTRAGSPDVWRVDTDGTNPTQLTHDPDLTGQPSFSPDGSFVYYDIMDGQLKHSIWRVSINGGPPEQITRFGARRPVVSPDSSMMVCEIRESVSETSPKMALVSLQSGQIVSNLNSLALLRSSRVRWSSDGKSLIYSETRDRVDNLWLLPIDGSPAQQLTNFDADRIFHFDITQNGKSWIMARGNEDSDVVTVSGFR